MGNSLFSSGSAEPVDGSVVNNILEAKENYNKIVVFSSSTCPYCTQAIKMCKSAGHDPVVVSAGPYRAILKNLTGSTSVPSIFINCKFFDM